MVASLLFLLLTFFDGIFGEVAFQMPFCVGPPNPVAIKPPYSKTLKTALDNLTSKFNSIMSSHNIPSLSANLIVGDDIIWSHGFGRKNLSDPNSGIPDGNTVYRIGSVTKVFTELHLLQVRDKGLVSLDDPLTKLLPEFRIRNPYASGRQIDLNQLAGHQSGLPKDPPCDWAISDCNYTTHEMLSRIATQRVLFPPGTRQSYSNTGITLLARGLESVTKVSWEDDVTQNILNPLGMSNTNSYFLPRFLKNFAYGYNNGVQAPQIELSWFRPTGNGYSTTNDLAKLISFFFQYDAVSKKKNAVLDPMSLRDWFQVIALKNGVTLGMSHPWETFGFGNYTLFTKNGGITGYSAEIGFFPELKIGFSILEASGSDPGFAQVWMELATFLLNVVEPEIWNLQPPPVLPSDVDSLAGTYTNNLGDKQTISVGPYGKSGYKTVRLLGWESTPNLILDYLGDDLYEMSLRGISYMCLIPAGGALAYVQFVRNSTGHVVRFDVIGNLYYDSWKQQQFWRDGVPQTTTVIPTNTKTPKYLEEKQQETREEQGRLNSEGIKPQKEKILSTGKQGLLRP